VPFRRTILLESAAFAVSGAVITVLVSWGCAIWSSAVVSGTRSDPAAVWACEVPDDWPDRPHFRNSRAQPGRSVIMCWWDYEQSGRTSALADGPVLLTAHTFVSGFPFRAMKSSCLDALIRSSQRLSHTSAGSGIPVPAFVPIRSFAGTRSASRLHGDAVAFPLIPVWSGFALNTAFYAALAFLLWCTPGFIKRTRRRRRGQCLTCGYDLNGMTTCPECGR
jgi:hypothetical protein